MSISPPLTGGLLGRLGSPASRRVLTLALPAVGEQLLNMAVGLVDTFMVGHLGAASVAAVGLSNQAVMLVTTFFAAVATGVTALVARHTGAREPDRACRVVGQGFLLGALLGLAASALTLPLAPAAMAALRAPADVAGPGALYLRIVSISFLLASWMFVGNAALRGAGDTRSPMLIMLVVNVVNVAVAYACIYGVGPLPSLGVAGSAIGAAVGRGVGGLLVTLLLLRGQPMRAAEVGDASAEVAAARSRMAGTLRLSPALALPERDQLRRILNVGLPAGAEMLMMRLGMTTYATTVAALGTASFAAHQLALQGESLAFMPGFGFAAAATTLVGQGLGAGDSSRARDDAHRARRMATAVMCFMAVLFVLFPGQIIGVFIDDPQVIGLGEWPLRLVAFSQPALATVMVMSGGLRGAGDTRATLVITAAGLWLVRVPLALVLTGPLGLIGAWIAMGIDLHVRGIGMWLRFRSGAWQRVKV